MNKNRLSAAITTIICMSLLIHQSYAQESRIATQSTRCAAIFSVLADTSADNTARQKKFLKAEAIFSELFVKETNDKKDKVTLEEAHRRRDLVMKEFRDTYTSRRAYIIEESVLCGAWGEGFLVQGENYGYVPVIPKVISHTIRTDYEAIAATAFAQWMQ